MYGRYSATAIPSDIPSDPGLARCDFFCVGASSQKFQKFQKSKKVPEPIRLSSGGSAGLTLAVPVPAPVAGHTLGRTVFSLTTGTASLFEFFLFPSLNCVM